MASGRTCRVALEWCCGLLEMGWCRGGLTSFLHCQREKVFTELPPGFLPPVRCPSEDHRAYTAVPAVGPRDRQ